VHESATKLPVARRRFRLGGLSLHPARYSGIYAWIIVVAVFAIWTPDTFLTMDTAKSVASEQAITGILALAVLIPLTAGRFDLSVAQTMGTSAVICATLMAKSDTSPELAIAVALCVGLVVGAINGFFVAGVGVDSFIATLGMTSVLIAVSQIVSGLEFVGPVPPSFQKIATNEVGGLPVLILYLLFACFLLWWLLEHTPMGRRLAATGANEDAARLAGVKTRRYVFFSLVASGGIAGIAGVLLCSRLGSVDPGIGPSYLLPTFAACFLGMTQLKPGRFNVWGTFVALYLLATGVEGLQLVSGQLWVTQLFNGIALVGAVSLAIVLGKRRRKEEAPS
jgi:ribose transport system permease protein